VQRLDTPRVVEVNDHVPQERTYFGWPSPAFFDPGDADLDLAALILTDGLSSRLQRSLVYDKQLCSDVVSFQASSEIAGMFVVQATARPGAPLAQVEQDMTEEIARLAKDGPTPAELNRAKAKWELQYLTGLERIGGFGGQADLLNQYNTFLGDPNKFAADVMRHRSATAESVRKTAASWLNTPNHVLIRFHPEEWKFDTSAKVDRSKQPDLGIDRPFQAPHVETAKLDNGLSVFVVERKDLPKVSVTFATRAGSVYDPAGQEGLASLTAESVIRGTKSRKALEIDDALADLGTSAQANSGREYSFLSLEVLESNLSAALGIVSDIARNPSFPAEEVDRQKKQTLDSLSQAENSPRLIAARLSSVLAFGRGHAYGHPVRGFTSTVAKVNAQDLKGFHEKYWKPGSSALVLVGDVSPEKALDLAKANFGSWAGGSAPAPQIGQPEPPGPGKVYLVNRPHAAQTYIEEILPAPRRDAPDYYAFSLADVVWGGSAGARLGMNLREQKGYSYGVFSFPSYFSKYGVWVAGGGVQTDKTKESVVEFQKELKYIAGEKPVTEAELTNAKSNRVRGYAQQFESMSRVSQQIVDLWSLNLPFSELQREPDELSKATLDRVNATAEKYGAPAKGTLLLVGDLSKIEAGVRSVNPGEIVYLDAEGKPVQR
jgi:zinc protease